VFVNIKNKVGREMHGVSNARQRWFKCRVVVQIRRKHEQPRKLGNIESASNIPVFLP